MSFLGGPECSAAANPLSKVSRHVQSDRSLHHDRIAGLGGAGGVAGSALEGVAGGASASSAAGPRAALDEFLAAPALRSPAVAPTPPQQLPFTQQQQNVPDAASAPFSFAAMDHELSRMSSPAAGVPRNWAAEFQTAPGPVQAPVAAAAAARTASPGAMGGAAHFSPAEFQQFAANGAPAQVVTTAAHMSPMPTMMMPPQLHMAHMQHPVMHPGVMFAATTAPLVNGMEAAGFQGKGKGKVVDMSDENWQAAFAKFDAGEQQQQDRTAANTGNASTGDPLAGTEANINGDFESIWRGIQREAKGEDADLEEAMNAWEGFDDLNILPDSLEPVAAEYLLEDQNPFANVLSDPYSTGLRILDEGGNLSVAALAFEEAVRRDPKRVDAWVKLGATQAENEKEDAAVRALEHALTLDPAHPEALMTLAVSYINEGYDLAAHRVLERWVGACYPDAAQKVKGPGLEPEAAGGGSVDRTALHNRVVAKFLQAARQQPGGQGMDPDVQVGLGVLLYCGGDFAKAVDCFAAALHSPAAAAEQSAQDAKGKGPAAAAPTATESRCHARHLLFNRLGATLANSDQSEEAIAAYERALEHRPNFVRARYNLGVSCMNLGCYQEAAQHFLGALAMHRVDAAQGRELTKELVREAAAADDGPMSKDQPEVADSVLDKLMPQNQSTNLLDSLRRVLTRMKRYDLVGEVVPGMDLERFKTDFDF